MDARKVGSCHSSAQLVTSLRYSPVASARVGETSSSAHDRKEPPRRLIAASEVQAVGMGEIEQSHSTVKPVIQA